MTRSQIYIWPWLLSIMALFGFHGLNAVLGARLNVLGIYPRHLFGLVGLIFSPLLHQDFNHVFFNAIPLFVLGLVILARDLQVFINVTVFVWVFGGFLVWCLGRRALHIGASGIVSGYFGYIGASAYLQPGISSVISAGFIGYYFGGIFLGIFPKSDKTSWESHFFGFISGIASAYLMTHVPANYFFHFIEK